MDKLSATNLSNEFLVTPYKKGIKLVEPEKNKSAINLFSMGDMLDLPMCVYFLDKSSRTQAINLECIETCKYPNIKKSIGNTIEIAAKNNSAANMLNNDKQVIKSEQFLIKEESILKKIDNLIRCNLSLKFPWYNDEGKIIGIFGCSIAFALHDFSFCLTSLINANLFSENPSSQNTLNSLTLSRRVGEEYLTNREIECLSLLMQSKSTKMIAQILDISPRTVETFIESLKFKFTVRTKTELILKAIELNL